MGYVELKKIYCEICKKDVYHQIIETNHVRPTNCRCTFCKNRLFENDLRKLGYWDEEKRCVK